VGADHVIDYTPREDFRIRPVIDRTFALEEAGAALDHLASGSARGRVVLEVTPSR
jgi:NADPH:quinone reductase-like Zn-dependent oxidoreductase